MDYRLCRLTDKEDRLILLIIFNAFRKTQILLTDGR